ncbi:hypothetical protein [Alistipes ihumii]|uniref:hypothetical protein n=1 Tax=Alistipes ihumii TaxID=1470347 RepID=UPI003AAB2702
MTIGRQWQALLERLGLPGSDACRVEPAQVERLNEALGSDPSTSPEPADGSLDLPKKTDPAVQGHPAASDLRETARATRTEPREDPSPAEATLSANAKAYEDDLRNFR